MNPWRRFCGVEATFAPRCHCRDAAADDAAADDDGADPRANAPEMEAVGARGKEAVASIRAVTCLGEEEWPLSNFPLKSQPQKPTKALIG